MITLGIIALLILGGGAGLILPRAAALKLARVDEDAQVDRVIARLSN